MVWIAQIELDDSGVKGFGDIHSDSLNEAATNVARGLRRAPLAPVWITCLMICFDVPVLAAALWIAQYSATPTADFRPIPAAAAGLSGAALAVFLIAVSGGYACAMLRRPVASMLRAGLSALGPVLAGAAILPGATPGWLFASACLALAAVVVPTRIGTGHIASWIVEAGLIERRAVIAGGGEHAVRLIRGLAGRPGNDIRFCGIFDERSEERSPIQILGIPKIGDYDDLVAFARLSEIDMVIIALPLDAAERIDELLDAFRVLPLEVRLSAFSKDFAFAQLDPDPLISAIERSFAPKRRLVKRSFDLVLASAALVLLAPVMLLAVVAIRLDTPGPVIFRQKRHGYNDRVIEVLKFRSMYTEAADPEARCVVTRGDPRVTRVGRFLRRSSIDELPQLFNVLKGDLSLVGPRPHAVDALSSEKARFSHIIDGYSARHRLPPGITGWAQINGWRGEIDDPAKLRARIEHDLFYIENWSLWMDIEVLLRTPLSLFDTRAAY